MVEWNRPLRSFVASPSLGGITVYHDFDWKELFGNRRRRFGGAQALIAEARERTPHDKEPALLLTTEPLLYWRPRWRSTA